MQVTEIATIRSSVLGFRFFGSISLFNFGKIHEDFVVITLDFDSESVGFRISFHDETDVASLCRLPAVFGVGDSHLDLDP